MLRAWKTKPVWLVVVLVLGAFLIMSGCEAEPEPEPEVEDEPEVDVEEPEVEEEEDEATYPEHEIEWIIPWSAGGMTDLASRGIADIKERFIGVPFVVENRTGGGGLVGFAETARAEPDGHVIGSFSPTFLIQIARAQDYVEYDRLEPVYLFNAQGTCISVPADAPYDTFDEFIEFARANPGAVRVGNSGTGAIWHLHAMILEMELGIELTHVPFEGGGPAHVAAAGGHVEAAIGGTPEALPLYESGDIKILAYGGTERSDFHPDVPTLTEMGYDLVIGTWTAVAVPAGTPDYVIETLVDAYRQVIETEDYRNYMDQIGAAGGFEDPQELRERMERELAHYKAVFEALDADD